MADKPKEFADMNKRTVLVILAAGMALAGCGGAGSEGSVASPEAQAPAAEPAAEPAPTTTAPPPVAPVATTVTTTRPVVAPKPAVVAPKPAAPKPAVVPTTVTTAAPVPVTTPTTAAPVVDVTTTTTTPPAPVESCSATLAKPSLAYAEEQTVNVTSNMPSRNFRVTYISYSTQSPDARYANNLGPTDASGAGSYSWKVIRSSNAPARVSVQFYGADGKLSGPACSAGFYTVT